jgi:CDP-diacylglycerol---glycerol-3-phosphate 3-phosphatidyltransferase
MDGLYALKPWYTRRLRVLTDRATIQGTSPDTFTLIGIFGAMAAAISIAMGWWPVAALWLAVRLAGANLDGAVARARNVSRPWGFVLNEIGDRASDLLMFAGLAVWAAHQGAWPVIWVLAAALAATLPTFASLAAAGAGATRRNGGPFGKTERCLAAIVAAAAPAAIAWVSAMIVVGSLVTAGLRLAAAHRELTAASR